MNFLYPQFLWALLALTIPVIVHLFNFKRYKTVYFSNNRFLRAVQKRSQSFNRLKHLVVLMCRTLALALLVVAFAQPYVPAEENTGTTNIYAAFYIDNSLSMKAKGLNGSLVDEARNQAVEIIKSLPDNFNIQIVSNSFEGKQQNYYSPGEAIQLIDEIKPSYAYRSAEEIKNRLLGPWQNSSRAGKGKLQVFLLSDFQQSQFGELKTWDQEDWRTRFVRFEKANESGNIAIDSVWFEQPVLQPGFDQQVNIKLKNYGREEVTKLSVKLELNGQLAGAREFTIQPEGEQEISFTIRPEREGEYAGKVTVEAGEPYFDNEFYFAFSIKEPLQILVIGEENRETFERLYRDDIYDLKISPLNQLNYGELGSYNLVILNRLNTFPSGLGAALQQNLEKGGNIVLLPDFEQAGTYNLILQNLGLPAAGIVHLQKIKASEIAYNDLIFKNVFSSKPKNPELPQVEQYFDLAEIGGMPVIGLENGNPLIMRYPRQNGQVLAFAVNFAPEAGSLSRHPIVVPIMLNAALYSTPRGALYYSAGRGSGQQFDNPGNSETPAIIRIEDRELIPPQRKRGDKVELYSLPAEVEPGVYTVTKEDRSLGQLAVNVDPRESNWTFWNSSDLENAALANPAEVLEGSANGLTAQIHSNYQGYPLWRWFLAGAVVFLLIEMLLLKLWK